MYFADDDGMPPAEESSRTAEHLDFRAFDIALDTVGLGAGGAEIVERSRFHPEGRRGWRLGSSYVTESPIRRGGSVAPRESHGRGSRPDGFLLDIRPSELITGEILAKAPRNFRVRLHRDDATTGSNEPRRQ